MTPVPGRRRTRAMASLRRPVVWTRGLVAMWFSVSLRASRGSGSAGLGVGHLGGHGQLGGVRVLRTGIDLKLLDHLTAERTLGEHAVHRVPDRVGRFALE